MARLTTAPHGGDVEAVSREYGIPIDELIDFSASINPLGLPAAARARLQRESSDVALLARYPDPGYSELRFELATRLSVSPECLTIANGSAALLGAVICALRPRTCLLPVPAFGEQQRALTAAGCEIERIPLSAGNGFRLDTRALRQMLQERRPSLCVLTNPHNPSGALTTAAEMSQVLRAASAHRVQLLIDEAFIDFAPNDTLTAAATGSDHLVVLRSLTKFFGMPALRVGYCVSTPGMTARIGAQLPEWPVTTLAAAAAAEALRDEDYAERTLRAVADERQRLRELLAGNGVDTYESAGNFLLIRLPERGQDSTALRAQLIRRHHLIVRDCRSFDGMAGGQFVRVAVRSRADNERLVDAIHAELPEIPNAD
ncbi:MAG TPA: aminotransferase class I/II-fold pyridoxal phosphate-dependent enzyme [Vicinamibacterales bacterium]|nr:aminotransferase class I/II-fold pyridoxal phosphate-dependent enzyme [Vicinamibacterales bacterium]